LWFALPKNEPNSRNGSGGYRKKQRKIIADVLVIHVGIRRFGLSRYPIHGITKANLAHGQVVMVIFQHGTNIPRQVFLSSSEQILLSSRTSAQYNQFRNRAKPSPFRSLPIRRSSTLFLIIGLRKAKRP
jgi:hypothetical protein